MLSALLFPVALAATPVSPAVKGHARAPQWSADGTRLGWELHALACTRVLVMLWDERTERLARVSIQGDRARLVPDDPRRPADPCAATATGAAAGFATGAPADASQALAWGPPGGAGFGVLALSGSDGSGDLDLFVVEGASGARVARHPGADSDPRWLPGDRRALVYTSARTGGGDLYLLDLDAGLERRITDTAHEAELYAAPAPDRPAVAYVGRDPSGDHLWLLPDRSGGGAQRLTDWPGMQVRPSWSPDGAALAFYANHEDRDRFDLYVARPATGPPRKLAEGVVLDPHGPDWTPDGAALVVVLQDDDRFDPVVRVDASTGALQALPTQTVGNGDLDLVRAIDGRTWLAVSAQGRTDDPERAYRRIYTMPLPATP